jgi:hypothetical protein
MCRVPFKKFEKHYVTRPRFEYEPSVFIRLGGYSRSTVDVFLVGTVIPQKVPLKIYSKLTLRGHF